jgi:hypothetical protein
VTVRRDVRALGVNHVALEVDSVDAALERWSRLLDVEVRGQRPGKAWIDLGDQIVALSEPCFSPARCAPPESDGVTTIAKSIDAAIDACVSRRDPVGREYGITVPRALEHEVRRGVSRIDHPG